MGSDSAISWTRHTFNPWIGCSKVSAGCANCYAERDFGEGGRYNRVKWGPNGTRSKTKTWGDPIKWDKAAKAAGERHRIFCASLADVFEDHTAIPQLWRDELWDLIRATPNLDWLLLTKRPENVKNMVPYTWFPGGGIQADWPANVWIGTSVEDQAAADERIPHLLRIPARVRFLSCEPLLGPVDLSRYLLGMTPWPYGKAPEKWSDVSWPEWVPDAVRAKIAEFWKESWGRGPRAYENDCLTQGVPPFGMKMGATREGQVTHGRHVHTWNNMCVLVGDDGSHSVESVPRTGLFDSTSRRQWQFLDWVICGGESGPNARPMHPDWARSLRDQCQAAGVAFHFKQWGEWGPGIRITGNPSDLVKACKDAVVCLPSGSIVPATGGGGIVGPGEYLSRKGKAAAGRTLDGREWNQFPDVGVVGILSGKPPTVAA